MTHGRHCIFGVISYHHREACTTAISHVTVQAYMIIHIAICVQTGSSLCMCDNLPKSHFTLIYVICGYWCL